MDNVQLQSLIDLLRMLTTGERSSCHWGVREHIVSLPGITECEIYEYDSSNSEFANVAGRQYLLQFEPIIHYDDIAVIEEISQGDELSSVHLAQRDSTLVGFIYIKFVNNSDPNLQYLDLLAHILVFIYNRKFPFVLFEHIQVPVNFNTERNAFLKKMKEVARKASGSTFGALRVLKDGRRLECLFIWGPKLDDLYELGNWSLSDINEFSPFFDAINTGLPVAISDIAEIDGTFAQHAINHGVGSFVVTPIRVGKNIAGVFTFAQKSRYIYSDTEINGYMSISNSVGVSIENYDNHHASVDTAVDQAAIAVALTGVDVAQAVRHEARDILDDCMTIIAHQMSLLDSERGQKARNMMGALSKLEEKLLSVSGSLDKIRDATRIDTKHEIENRSIFDIWGESINQVRGKLNNNDIITQKYGADLTINCYPDRLRNMFLHFISNSIDSHKLKGKKRGRHISLSVEKTNDSEHSITMIFSDNAGGIDKSKLSIPDEYTGMSLEQQLFQKYVTSKEGGGWGLYLVRKIAAEHSGSVDLVNYRGGVEFRIRLKKKL